MTKQEAVENMIDYLRSVAYCPCCTGVETCEEGCHREEDARRFDETQSFEAMKLVRDLLNDYYKAKDNQ